VKVECLAMAVTDSINLSGAKSSAYTEIVGWKKYIDNNVNQQLVLMVCDNALYNAENPSAMEWTILNENIAPGLIQNPNPVKESDLTANGTQIIDIPQEFWGKKIRMALLARHLNPALGNLGREPFIYKWQVRYQ